MKCWQPDCEAEVVRAKKSGTMMGRDCFTDVDGVKHCHDPNWYEFVDRCRKGHYRTTNEQLECSACGKIGISS